MVGAEPNGLEPLTPTFLKVPESKVVKNRIHIYVKVGGGRQETWDVRWSRVTAAVARFTVAAATVIGVDPPEGTPDHMVMADPEGNEFCVL